MSEQVGIRPVFIDMFLGSEVSVSEQVGIRPMCIHMFLGSAVSVSEQVGIQGHHTMKILKMRLVCTQSPEPVGGFWPKLAQKHNWDLILAPYS